MDIGTIIQVVVPVATVAAAYGGVRQALNGTRQRTERIETKVDTIVDVQTQHGERLAVVETKLDR